MIMQHNAQGDTSKPIYSKHIIYFGYIIKLCLNLHYIVTIVVTYKFYVLHPHSLKQPKLFLN
jgi:hypothetical protein